MKKLIECLQIFAKYADHDYPTHCEHDVLLVVGIEKDALTPEDEAKVRELGGFHWSREYDCWTSSRFGSA